MTNDPNPTHRLLDAAANRAGEAARVVEDYVRFVLNDVHLTQQCKQLRHDLADVLVMLDRTLLCAARDTPGDVGCQVTTEAEMLRSDAPSVCIASFKRLEQSLRSLEEFSKLTDAQAAAQFEQLRYRTYTLEKAVSTTDESQKRLAHTRLCVLVDGCAELAEFKGLVASLVAAEVGMIQLRDKTLEDRELLERAKLARRATLNSNTLLMINDRADIAALARADGVHLGQGDLSVADARAIVGPAMLIGVSTHSLDDAQRAVLEGANYIGVGPVFASATKQFEEFPGIELLSTVAANITLPTFAIGGIDESNLDRVLATGVECVAVSHAVIGQSDPQDAAERLSRMLHEHATAAL